MRIYHVFFIALYFCLTLAWPHHLHAHGGRTNAQGCHGGSKPYHCHNKKQTPRFKPSTQGDKNCSDFTSQAQRFFERAGPGDPHRLDADRDNIACESLS